MTVTVYDDRGHATQERHYINRTGASGPNIAIERSYDARGNEVLVKGPYKDGPLAGNVPVTTSVYDEFGYLVGQTGPRAVNPDDSAAATVVSRS